MSCPVRVGTYWTGYVDGRDQLSQLLESFKIDDKSFFVTRRSGSEFAASLEELSASSTCRSTDAVEHRLRFSERSGTLNVPYDGVPFIVAGPKLVLDCLHGKARNHAKKETT